MAVTTVAKVEPAFVNPRGQLSAPICEIYPLRRLEASECVTQIPQYMLRSAQDTFALNAQKIQAANAGLVALRNKVQTQASFSSLASPGMYSGMMIEKNKAEKTWKLFPRVDASGWDCLAKLAAFGVLTTAETTLAVCKFTHDVADQISPWRRASVGNKRRADQVEPGSETMPPAKLVLSQKSLEAPAPMTPMPMGDTAEKTPGLMRVVRVTVTSPASTPLQLHLSIPTN